MKKFNDEETLNICNLYLSGMSLQKIGKKYGCCKTVIKRILDENNVKTRDDSHKIRHYTLNENYFDVIDTPSKAYILGILFADGHNCVDKDLVKLELQERDIDILEKINFELESNRDLKFSDKRSKNPNWQNTYRLSIYNKHISQTLENKGMIQNKSLVLDFPKWLDKNLYSHFIRGFIDGDGHIANNRYSVEIVGTKMFLESINEICNELFGFYGVIKDTYNKDSITKTLRINTFDKSKQFLDWIYNGATIYMNRKYEKYKEKYLAA